MKLQELEVLCRKLEETKQKHLEALNNYLVALEKAMHGPSWYKIDFESEKRLLQGEHEWLDKEIVNCKKILKETKA